MLVSRVILHREILIELFWFSWAHHRWIHLIGRKVLRFWLVQYFLVTFQIVPNSARTWALFSATKMSFCGVFCSSFFQKFDKNYAETFTGTSLCQFSCQISLQYIDPNSKFSSTDFSLFFQKSQNFSIFFSQQALECPTTKILSQ